MPDWSPVRSFGGYGSWGEAERKTQALQAQTTQSCSCSNHCAVHGHDHARAWLDRIPVSDLKSFWGALGCACWEV
jgi:hypothetical protein